MTRFVKEYILTLIIVMSCMVLLKVPIDYKTLILCFIINIVFEIRNRYNDHKED